MSEKREKQTKSKRRIWRGVTTATASLLTLSMSATLVIDGFRTDIDKFLGTQSTKMVTEDVQRITHFSRITAQQQSFWIPLKIWENA